jgi:hypothetical protein
MSDKDFQSYPELQNLEITKLRRKILDLEVEVRKCREILQENDLLDEVDNSSISNEEAICLEQIKMLKELSDKAPLTLEDVKILDLLVKNLLAIRGKAPIDDSGKKKKKPEVNVADLLKIAERK